MIHCLVTNRFGQIWRALRIILPGLVAAVPCTVYGSALSHWASENHDRYGASWQEFVSYIAFIGAAIMFFATVLVARSNRAGLIGFTSIFILLVLQIMFSSLSSVMPPKASSGRLFLCLKICQGLALTHNQSLSLANTQSGTMVHTVINLRLYCH